MVLCALLSCGSLGQANRCRRHTMQQAQAKPGLAANPGVSSGTSAGAACPPIPRKIAPLASHDLPPYMGTVPPPAPTDRATASRRNARRKPTTDALIHLRKRQGHRHHHDARRSCWVLGLGCRSAPTGNPSFAPRRRLHCRKPCLDPLGSRRVGEPPAMLTRRREAAKIAARLSCGVGR